MSQSIYNSYSRFLAYAKTADSWLFKLSDRALHERFKISANAAKVILMSMTFPKLHKPYIIASLLAYAKHIDNDKFWKKFQYKVEYIFIEFARRNFFPLVHDVPLANIRKGFVKIMGNTRNYEAVLAVVHPKAKRQISSFDYICTRSRGHSEHLANLIIASLILPNGLFDWNSCLRGEECENLMMFGLQEMRPDYFRTFAAYTLNEYSQAKWETESDAELDEYDRFQEECEYWNWYDARHG